MLEVLPKPVSAKPARFSGHESFACRYAWLPKAYRALKVRPDLFSHDEDAMLELGLGKNMVKSLRFWVEVMGLVEPATGRNLVLTAFANDVFGKGGHDPYLEDARTLWLIHWIITARDSAPVFAWDFLINHWPLPEFSRSEALAAFHRESRRLEGGHSDVTLAQHLDVFLHTYLPSRNSAIGVEDSLDGPLVDLGLLLPSGERRGDAGRIETVYAFRREPKPEITPALFDYCLMDFWSRFHHDDQTLSLRAATLAPCSPGQVFKLTEDDVRARLEETGERAYAVPYSYKPSAVQGLLTRRVDAPALTLDTVYGRNLRS